MLIGFCTLRDIFTWLQFVASSNIFIVLHIEFYSFLLNLLYNLVLLVMRIGLVVSILVNPLQVGACFLGIPWYYGRVRNKIESSNLPPNLSIMSCLLHTQRLLGLEGCWLRSGSLNLLLLLFIQILQVLFKLLIIQSTISVSNTLKWITIIFERLSVIVLFLLHVFPQFCRLLIYLLSHLLDNVINF